MAWNEAYVKVETVEIAATTRIVTAPRRYHPGSGDLIIYLNGMYAVPGKDYKEITPFSVEFLYELVADDNVVFHYQKLW